MRHTQSCVYASVKLESAAWVEKAITFLSLYFIFHLSVSVGELN